MRATTGEEYADGNAVPESTGTESEDDEEAKDDAEDSGDDDEDLYVRSKEDGERDTDDMDVGSREDDGGARSEMAVEEEKKRLRKMKRGSISAKKLKKMMKQKGHGEKSTAFKRPPCAAERCSKESRPDSKYCSDRCGVLTAETTLSKALIFSLEEREGRERAKKLCEARENKIHRGQVSTYMRVRFSSFRLARSLEHPKYRLISVSC